MIFYKRFSILLVMVLSLIRLSAQEMLSLQECRELAIKNNKELKIATEQERKAHYEKTNALMKFFPKLSASGAFLHSSEDIFLLNDGIVPGALPNPLNPSSPIVIPQDVKDKIHNAGKVDMDKIWVFGVTLTQPIFTGGKIIALNDITKYAKELAATMKETTQTDLIVQVDEAYWQIVSIANKTKLAQSYVDLLAKMDADIHAYYDEGLTTKADVLSVSVKLNEAEVNLIKAQNGLTLSKMLLNQLIGYTPDTPINLVDENLEQLNLKDIYIDVPSNLSSTIDNRTEIKSLKLVNEIYKKKEKIAFADFLPQAGLMLSYTATNPNFRNGVQYNLKGSFMLGVTLNVPLNFISTSSKVNAAKADRIMQEYKLEDVKEKLELQINQANFKLTEAQKVYNASLKNTEKANENLMYANAGFEEGVIPTSDVLAAHTAWVNAQTSLIEAQIDIKLCRVYLQKALGQNIDK